MKLPNIKLGEIRKPSKTLAGVTPLAVMLKPKKCEHGTCIYCPQLNVPQSYTPLSPPVIRAKMLNYSPLKQVKARLKAYKLMNHPTDKIELIIMGGTFLEYPKKYQSWFIKQCYDALNNKKSKNLEESKRLNEKSKNRCVALCIETRPDKCGKKEIKRILKFGATRVELGVQAIDNKIYKKINRGHNVKDVIESTELLRNSGFKIGYHIMPGLPGSNQKKDLQMIDKIFSSQDFKPDQLKVYPCQVLKNSELEKVYQKGKFKPYSTKQTKSLLIKIMKKVPEYCRVMRIMREIPPPYLTSGIKRIDLRAEVEKQLRKGKNKIKEIRFREIGFNLNRIKTTKTKEKINTELKIKKTEYKAGKGKEIFLQITNKQDILFGLLRLRFPNQKQIFISELKNSAIIRELHIYGKSLDIGKKSKTSLQHTGLGKWLMKEAEKIIKKQKKKYNLEKIAVISGVGVREYYRKLGYQLEKNYMCKYLK